MALGCPEKNGADFFLSQFDAYVHCDVYIDNNLLILRTSPGKFQDPPSGKTHGKIMEYDAWFDEGKSFGTLVVTDPRNWVYYGYEGLGA